MMVMVIYVDNNDDDGDEDYDDNDVYLRDIQAVVREKLAEGMNPFAIAASVDLPKYRNLAQYDQWFTLNVQVCKIKKRPKVHYILNPFNFDNLADFKAAVVNEVLGPLSWLGS